MIVTSYLNSCCELIYDFMIIKSYAAFHDLWIQIWIDVYEEYSEIMPEIMCTKVSDVSDGISGQCSSLAAKMTSAGSPGTGLELWPPMTRPAAACGHGRAPGWPGQPVAPQHGRSRWHQWDMIMLPVSARAEVAAIGPPGQTSERHGHDPFFNSRLGII